MTETINRSCKHLASCPLAAVVVAYVIFTMVLLQISQRGWQLVYPLDDTYIHLAVARSLAANGIWGPTVHEFASACSSFLWPIALAGFIKLFGLHIYWPLILSACFGVGIIVLFYGALCISGASRRAAALWSATPLFLTPLVPQVLSGMESTAQAFFSLASVFSFLKLTAQASDECHLRSWSTWLFLAICVLLVSTRLEGLFLIVIYAVLAWSYSHWLSCLILAAGASPLVLHAVISVPLGGEWLPNSVLLKAYVWHTSSFKELLSALGLRGVEALLGLPRLAFLSLFAAWLLIRLRNQKGLHAGFEPAFHQQARYGLLIFLAALALHLQFANTGWFARYEFYLVVLGLFAIAQAMLVFCPKDTFAKGMFSALLIATSVSLGCWCWWYVVNTPRAVKNIHDQQIQVTRFVSRFYNDSVVAVADIGATSYFTSVRLIDTLGLGSNKIAKARLMKPDHGEILGQELGSFISDAKLLISYPARLPFGWHEVARLKIRENFVCYTDTVLFSAPSAVAAAILRMQLESFKVSLPSDIELTFSPIGQ